MINVLKDIVETVRADGPLDAIALSQLLNAHNKDRASHTRQYSKKRILPYYLKLKEEDPCTWEELDIDEELEKRLFETLRMKPRRTSSGVATITVITKPNPCTGNCLYCPNDVRMPKSYLHKEPACQRAERNYFDPFLQVRSRLRALTQMGHTCDKIELIILGGSWTDYPLSYQIWFMTELFRALNTAGDGQNDVQKRRELYKSHGVDSRDEVIASYTDDIQQKVTEGSLCYNDALEKLYGAESPWGDTIQWQTATLEQLREEQKRNEIAAHRVVGLVVETRPEALDMETLVQIREFGCTKVQIGVQSLRPEILRMNRRTDDPMLLRRAFDLLRIFGFKLHTHFMVNLYGSTPDEDMADYRIFIEDPSFMPDEVKLYPCVLVDNADLTRVYEQGAWRPYTEDELIRILANDICATPPFTRVSRMIRDISAEDIIAGSKKTNLRQLVELSDEVRETDIQEIRYREIAGANVDVQDLSLDTIEYTTSNTDEYFLQWVTSQGNIAGFLRLSLPHHEYLEQYRNELPEEIGCAMIREVHVYGQVANLHKADGSAQHLGLGKKLIERACIIAQEHGFSRINVISSVGTRMYYRKLGFEDGSLYQHKEL